VQHRTAYVIQQVRQLPPPPIEAALRRQMMSRSVKMPVQE